MVRRAVRWHWIESLYLKPARACLGLASRIDGWIASRRYHPTPLSNAVEIRAYPLLFLFSAIGFFCW